MTRLTAEGRAERRSYERSPVEDCNKRSFDLIDAFSAALCVVNDDLQVIKANAAACEYIEDRSDGGFMRLIGRSIACPPASLRKKLQEALVHGTQATLILRTAKFDPLICTVRPIKADVVCGMVALTPLNGGAGKVVPCLREIYKLSKAEAEIAAASAAGMDVVELAQSRKVSIHTLRAQIASIKSKMGLSRMTEIAVAVCRIEAAVTWL